MTLEETLGIVLARPNTANISWASPPMRIGKHYWRVVVIPSAGNFCNQYQWIGVHDTFWHVDTEWLTFDGNESNGGMPAGIKKLYYKNLAEINVAMRGESPPPEQTLL